MDTSDIPIFKKTYDLYKLFYSYRNVISKQDRHTIWQRCDGTLLDILENVIIAGRSAKNDKLPALERANTKLNILRVFVRLMKDTKGIDNKKYIAIQETTDEIGRMLGGWIRSIKQ